MARTKLTASHHPFKAGASENADSEQDAKAVAEWLKNHSPQRKEYRERDKHKGAACELLASAWLLRNGYEVFRNVSAVGEADLVAFRDGEFIRIDATAARMQHTKSNGSRTAVPYSKLKHLAGRDVRVLLVKPDGECLWAEEAILERFPI